MEEERKERERRGGEGRERENERREREREPVEENKAFAWQWVTKAIKQMSLNSSVCHQHYYFQANFPDQDNAVSSERLPH